MKDLGTYKKFNCFGFEVRHGDEISTYNGGARGLIVDKNFGRLDEIGEALPQILIFNLYNDDGEVEESWRVGLQDHFTVFRRVDQDFEGIEIDDLELSPFLHDTTSYTTS